MYFLFSFPFELLEVELVISNSVRVFRDIYLPCFMSICHEAICSVTCCSLPFVCVPIITLLVLFLFLFCFTLGFNSRDVGTLLFIFIMSMKKKTIDKYTLNLASYTSFVREQFST